MNGPSNNPPDSPEEHSDYDAIKQQLAGTTEHYEVDGTAVKVVYDETGETSRRFGLQKNGTWAEDWPEYSVFTQEAVRINHDRFVTLESQSGIIE